MCVYINPSLENKLFAISLSLCVYFCCTSVRPMHIRMEY